jgi:hypothetical protein
MSLHRPMTSRTGALLQSGMPKAIRRGDEYRANGLLVRGVVIQTYAEDEAQPIVAPGDSAIPQTKVYCDVLVYSDIPNVRQGFLPRVLVSQERGGMHEGAIWKPRAARIDTTKGSIDTGLFRVDPRDIDGDHVLVGFMDDALNQPVILRGLPHPRRDVGNSAEELGVRMRLRKSDGEPHFEKHRGSFWGADDKGNFVIDLRRAHSGQYGTDGSEPPAPEDGAHGNFIVKMPVNSTLRIELGSGRVVEINDETGEITVTNVDLNLNASGNVNIGAGAAHPLVHGDTWQTAHGAYDAAVAGMLGLINAVFAAMAAEKIVVELNHPATTAAILALASTGAPFLTTINTVLANPALLSQTVKTK